jgi:hypothetical protein
MIRESDAARWIMLTPKVSVRSRTTLSEQTHRNRRGDVLLIRENECKRWLIAWDHPIRDCIDRRTHFPVKSRVLNNCRASVGSNELSNIVWDAFRPAQSMDACEGRSRRSASGDLEERASSRHGIHPPPRIEMDSVDDSRRDACERRPGLCPE